VTNSISSQRGSFSIEFAIVGVCFSLLLIFASDLVVKMSMKGKLDRLSFSAVSILKERTQLYDQVSSSNYSQAKQIYEITSLSLNRMSNTFSRDRFGVHVEEMTFSKTGKRNPIVTHQFGLPFTTSQLITDLESLSVLSSWGRRVPLYRVSVCYQTDNWFGSLIGANYDLVCSESIMIGR
jgi:tight adherence protein F